MAMIAWQVALTKDSAGRMRDPGGLWTAIEQFGSELCGPGYEFQLRFLPRTASRLMYPSMAAANLPPIFEDVRAAYAEGVGALILAPAIDPGVIEARGLVRGMSVLGSLESALALSTFVGNRVGIVAVHPGYTRQVELVVKRYGLWERMITNRPVRDFTIDYNEIDAALAGDPSRLIGSLESVATGLVEDGADVIVGAHQFLGVCLYPHGYRAIGDTGVPFIDCGAAGVLMARTLIATRDLIGLEPSNADHSLFRQVPDDVIAAALG